MSCILQHELFFCFDKFDPRRALEQIHSVLCFLRSVFRYPHFFQQCLECHLRARWEGFLKNNVKLTYEFRLAAPIHITDCCIKKSLSQRHWYFFIELSCMRFFFNQALLCVHFYASTRIVQSSIHVDNSGPKVVGWL